LLNARGVSVCPFTRSQFQRQPQGFTAPGQQLARCRVGAKRPSQQHAPIVPSQHLAVWLSRWRFFGVKCYDISLDAADALTSLFGAGLFVAQIARQASDCLPNCAK